MTEPAPYSRLIRLPWELRRLIVVEVVRGARGAVPSLSRELIESRVRLRNRFDDNFPEQTNFYVPRDENRYFHGKGLRATCRQLLNETDLMIEKELKPEACQVPFVLDVMLVKDIGVFPSWMSFPYQPKHIETLTVNVRIVRPGTAILPNEWVEKASYVARYIETAPDKHPARWHSLMAILLYGLGYFSTKPGPAQPGAQYSQPAVQGSLVDYQSDTMDAYLLPAASYITDELFINIKEFEYDANNKPIPAGVDDSCGKSPFYKKGGVQFARELFEDFAPAWKGDYKAEKEQGIVSQGKLACYQFEEMLTNTMANMGSMWTDGSATSSYLRMMAHSVGAVSYSGHTARKELYLRKHPSNWTDVRCIRGLQHDYSEENVNRLLAREAARTFPDRHILYSLRTVLIRQSNGWGPDD